MTRRPLKLCSVCGGPHYCKGLCSRHYQAQRHKDHKKIKRDNVVEASAIGGISVNGCNIYRGEYAVDGRFVPQLVKTCGTEGEAEQVARAMVRQREPVTTERRGLRDAKADCRGLSRVRDSVRRVPAYCCVCSLLSRKLGAHGKRHEARRAPLVGVA